MRNVIIILILGFFSCQSTDKEQQKSNEISRSDSEKDSVISDSAVKSNSIDKNEQSANQFYSFELDVFYTLSYCGGAPPSEEMLLELKTPRRLTGSELILIECRSKEKHIVRTGTSSIMIPQGEYELFLTRKINREEAFHFNPDCDPLLMKALRKFKVDKDIKESLTIHFDCDPCDPTIKMRP